MKEFVNGLKRLRIYFKEMYPILPRLFLGYLLFSELYLLY